MVRSLEQRDWTEAFRHGERTGRVSELEVIVLSDAFACLMSVCNSLQSVC